MWGLEEIYNEMTKRICAAIGDEGKLYPTKASEKSIEIASEIIQNFAQEIGIETNNPKIVTHTRDGQLIRDAVSIAKRIWWLHYHKQPSAIKALRRRQLRTKGKKMTIWEQYEWQHFDNDVPVRIVGNYGAKTGG